MIIYMHDDSEIHPNEFTDFFENADQPLYPDCKNFTNLSALVECYNLKVKFGMSDTCFASMLIMVGKFLPEGHGIPSSMYQAKKALSALGMDYEKIHACCNDCILFRNDFKDATTCPTCGASRWKLGKDKRVKEGVPAKVLWYFPPIPRFKRMFETSKIAENFTWHASDRENDCHMRHLADSPQWKLVNHKWPELGEEARNLRLGLSTDGFNPHRSLSSRYSCWPVILVTYNLPPWLCMKRKFMMLTLLISGPKQPGNDIDVYLAPLIDDLKSLWVGIEEVYDAYRAEYFKLRAVLLWTINDFPAYGNLSGCIVKGHNACPICGEETDGHRLVHSQKICYINHRRFLSRHHPYRKQLTTNGKVELRSAPVPLTGQQVLRKVEGFRPNWGKKTAVHEHVNDSVKRCWKKKSIFFELKYWDKLYVRHCLDVMHIEKNICDSILGTLLNIPGKTKDGVAARLDLVDMGIKLNLKPKDREKKLPLAWWNLTKDEKRVICLSFFGMKVPEGYCSNIKNLVSLQDLQLLGLKSHDCHTLMQELLPIAIHSVLPKQVRYAITRLCFFFNSICDKVVDISTLDKLQEDVVLTLCQLEMYFAPSFFDIMVHLVVHLVREVRLCGPVCFRWMYPFERFMKVLKDYVRNRNRPEGCMAECYVAEEALEYCLKHSSNLNTVGIPSTENNGRSEPTSAAFIESVTDVLFNQAHLTVLVNTDEVQPYIDEHMDYLKMTYPRFKKQDRWLQDKHMATFVKWFQERCTPQIAGNASERASCSSAKGNSMEDSKKQFVHIHEQDNGEEKSQNSKGKPCKLAVDLVDNIVARGTVLEIDATNPTIHGVPLGKGNERVVVDIVIDAEAFLPFPIKDDDIFTVGQAVGYVMAWHKHLVILTGVEIPRKCKHTVEKLPKAPEMDFHGMPKSLKILCRYAQNMIKMNGNCIVFDMEERVFGSPRPTHILNEDILQLGGMEKLSATCIVIYMRYLYTVLEELDMVGSVSFVDPAVISAPWCGTSFVRSRKLADRFKGAQNDQMFFIPYNSGDHWMLTIVHPVKETIYFVDSFYQSIIDSEWKHVVNDAINIFNRQRNKQGRKSPLWKILMGAPRQPTNKECGYYVMRFMRDLILEDIQGVLAKVYIFIV
ncbi:uncharacterized protein LOC133711589 [Rosa rugosa]|uniref:uncharacterized protein LOC133711589 n=1 Tax=Rosa rugosa TaxID=74645 RepID=UPI002B4123BA|nr:uncharacterized protein LOC133711589 [Rosa rugosa]